MHQSKRPSFSVFRYTCLTAIIVLGLMSIIGTGDGGGPGGKTNYFLYFLDADGDGYGNPDEYKYFSAKPKNVFESEDCPNGYVLDSSDCDDCNAAVNPGATEVCGDGLDNNCGGSIDEGCGTCTDNDEDGYYLQDNCGTAVDCNDYNVAVNPGTAEICDDGVDNNCDGDIDEECGSNVIRFENLGDGTVRDNDTGLIWLQNANSYLMMTWREANNEAAALSSGENGAWRLPTRAELQGLGTDPPANWLSGYPPPTWLPGFLPTTWATPGEPFTSVQVSLYWSSTENGVTLAWCVNMTDGYTVSHNKDNKAFTWLVRGSYSDEDRFEDMGDGTVRDNDTGLIWLKNANSFWRMTWSEAKHAASILSNGEHGLSDGSSNGDWRLPTRAELQGLGTSPQANWESGYHPPEIWWTTPGKPFTSVQTIDLYWSSTKKDDIFVWCVDMFDGLTGGYPKTNQAYTWMVRKSTN